MNFKALRLILALALFTGWMVYLGYAALNKYRGPIVSHIQAAAATTAVVAEVAATEDGRPAEVKVVEVLASGPNGPAPGNTILIANLGDVRGFDGPGQYLLLLENDPGKKPYYVVGQQRSPGNDLSGVGKSAIYRWTDEIRRQYDLLKR